MEVQYVKPRVLYVRKPTVGTGFVGWDLDIQLGFGWEVQFGDPKNMSKRPLPSLLPVVFLLSQRGCINGPNWYWARSVYPQ